MKIGIFVQQHLDHIFSYCDNVEHGEIDCLLDPKYSKKTFALSFPFCIEVGNIDSSQSMRYWKDSYLVGGKQVRVTSQWYERSRPLFIKYLDSKGLGLQSYLQREERNIPKASRRPSGQLPSSQANSRYRGNHIGNAQNLFIRTILSSIGLESFNEADWNSTKEYFSNRCAYCGAKTKLEMEHAIPINKKLLGEHRLGNLVPSCKPCNNSKSGKDFREFLQGNVATISRIEAYMGSRNYVPLEDNQQVIMILDMAHKEVASLAERYIRIINDLLCESSKGGGEKS